MTNLTPGKRTGMLGVTPSDGKAGPVMLHTPLPADREAALLAAWAETVTFVPPETGVPDLDPEPDDPDDEPDSG